MRSQPHAKSQKSPPTHQRVRRACDRCRLKKHKCNAALPCSRCKDDNVLCLSNDRRKPHDENSPKGYIEALEQEQIRLTATLRSVHDRLQADGLLGVGARAQSSSRESTWDILASLQRFVIDRNIREGSEVLEGEAMSTSDQSTSDTAWCERPEASTSPARNSCRPELGSENESKEHTLANKDNHSNKAPPPAPLTESNLATYNPFTTTETLQTLKLRPSHPFSDRNQRELPQNTDAFWTPQCEEQMKRASIGAGSVNTVEDDYLDDLWLSLRFDQIARQQLLVPYQQPPNQMCQEPGVQHM